MIRAISILQAIARHGPTLEKTANGRAFGDGFYTTTNFDHAVGYAKGTGSVCVCKVLPGRAQQHGDKSTTLATLSKQRPPMHSVAPAGLPWHVLMHPDAVRVECIVDLSEGQDSEQAERREKMQEAMRAWQAAEHVRVLELEKHDSRGAMADYVISSYLELATSVGPDAPDGALVRARALFKREQQQFEQGLPMFARKRQFLDLVTAHQAMILKGGTGVGKTVTVPQWVYDHVFFATGRPDARVAVLVPRKSIAHNLATYIADVRGCAVGTHVGVGTGDMCLMSDDSNIVFMTYGWFLAVSAGGGDHFEGWDAVLLDEAHERNPDADRLLTLMGQAAAARPSFKAIVMSATIDVDQFSANLEALVPGTCPVLEVPGVTFPVEVVHCQSWDSQEEGAEHVLARQIMQIFNHEQGNLLVFLATVNQVEDLVSVTKGLLAHDKRAVIKGMYAALPASEQDEIVRFSDGERYPQYSGKRLICFSTNVAEAGVTIAGISAVVDTGRQISVVYNQITRTSSAAQTWISKASHLQRRGRAGRTARGRCYAMFTEREYEKMPQYSVPAIETSDLSPFYLSMISAGHAPSDFPLLTLPSDERTDAAFATLHTLGAATADRTVTELGQTMAKLPVPPTLARCIVAAVELGVSDELCVIAAMVSQRGSVFGRRGTAKEHFRVASGDHETLLHVYEEWSRHSKRGLHWQRGWCKREGLGHEVLEGAGAMIVKIHRAMHNCELPVVRSSSGAAARAESIGKALCAGLGAQLAVAQGTCVGGGFTLVQDYASAPQNARVHPASVMPRSEEGVRLVVFQGKQTDRNGGLLLTCVTSVDASWATAVVGQSNLPPSPHPLRLILCCILATLL